MKHHKIISFITAVIVSSLTNGFSNAPKSVAPGGSTCFLINPPNSSVEWSFGAGQSVQVYLENLNILPVTVTLVYYFASDEYWHTIIPSKSLTETKTYSVFGYTPIQYRFSLSTASGAAQIVGHASW